MKNTKPPITKYPGNKWFARQVERSGSESTIPFIHGVVRGALANPFAVDPGAAMGEVFVDADMQDISTDDLEKITLAFLFLWNDTARSLSSSRPFPQAVLSDIRTEAGGFFILSEASDLVEGFVRGFYLRNKSQNSRLPRVDVCLKLLEDEGEWCRMMYESPDLLEKTFPHGGFPSDVIAETAEWIEECTRKVALLARDEMKGKNEAEEKC
jgi:hypothetical protein